MKSILVLAVPGSAMAIVPSPCAAAPFHTPSPAVVYEDQPNMFAWPVRSNNSIRA